MGSKGLWRLVGPGRSPGGVRGKVPRGGKSGLFSLARLPSVHGAANFNEPSSCAMPVRRSFHRRRPARAPHGDTKAHGFLAGRNRAAPPGRPSRNRRSSPPSRHPAWRSLPMRPTRRPHPHRAATSRSDWCARPCPAIRQSVRAGRHHLRNGRYALDPERRCHDRRPGRRDAVCEARRCAAAGRRRQPKGALQALPLVADPQPSRGS